MSETSIRPAASTDLEALTTLYNHYVESSPATFDIEPRTLEQRAEWMSHYATAGPHRLLVAEAEGRVVGYASSSPFRPKAAYDTSVESTIYMAHDFTGRGVGRQLYGALFESLRDEPVHRAYAGITVPNPASEALHVALGFEPVGLFDEVGSKFDRYWSVRWFEKALAP